MESRRVILLTEGWKLGWLDFEYKNPFSRRRENFILGEVEKHLVKELLQLQAQVDASTVSAVVPLNKKVIDVPYKTVKSYSELALPYQFKKSNIDLITPDQGDAWEAMLKEKREQLLKERERLEQEKNNKT